MRQPNMVFFMRSGNHSQLCHQIQIRWVQILFTVFITKK